MKLQTAFLGFLAYVIGTSFAGRQDLEENKVENQKTGAALFQSEVKNGYGEAFEEEDFNKILSLTNQEVFPPDNNTGALQVPYPGRMPLGENLYGPHGRRLVPRNIQSNSTGQLAHETAGTRVRGARTNYIYRYDGIVGLRPVSEVATIKQNQFEGDFFAREQNSRPSDYSTKFDVEAGLIEIADNIQNTSVVIPVEEDTGFRSRELLSDKNKNRLYSAIALATMAVCTAIGAAVTTGVGTPLIAVNCLGFAADVVAFLAYINVFGNPTADDATLTITSGDVPNADGDVLGVTYHRWNGESDDDNLGYIGRNAQESWREDLDASELKVLELRIKSWNDICVSTASVSVGPEPSGTGTREDLALGATVIISLAENRPGKSTDCVWFGDTARNALGNFQLYWRQALKCRQIYGDYISDDYAYCLQWAMKSYDIKKDGGGYSRWTYTGNSQWSSLPSFLENPFRRLTNRYTGSADLHNRHAANGQPVNLRGTRSWDEPAQDWDIDRQGRIRSRVDPTKCLEAGKQGELYDKVFLWDCHSGLHQQWYFYTNGRIKNKAYDKYLGVAYCGTSSDPNKQRLELRNYEDGQCGTAQKWYW